MKKIVFVEKDDNSSYDPVSTFINNRKSNSVVRPPASTAIKTTIEKKITDTKLDSKKAIREKEYSHKIGRKGDYIPPKAEYKKKEK